MIDEDLAEHVSVESPAYDEDMLADGHMHFIYHALRHGHGVDEKGRLVRDGSGKHVRLVGARGDKIAVKAVCRFSREAQPVGSALVLRDARKINAVALFHVRILGRLRHLPDGESAGNDGVFHPRGARIDRHIRFGEERLGDFDLYLVFGEFEVRRVGAL